MKLYHADLDEYDILNPVSLDLGNKYNPPGWSLFCFKDYEKAIVYGINFSLARYAKDKYGKSFNHLISKNNKKVLLGESDYERIIELVNSEDVIFHVYTINVDIKDVHIGQQTYLDEYTIRKSVKPTIIDRIHINMNMINKYVDIVPDEKIDSYVKEVRNSRILMNRGLLSFVLSHDTNIEENRNLRIKLRKAVRNGELSHGDDIIQFMKENDYSFKEIGMIERLLLTVQNKNLNERSNIMELYESNLKSNIDKDYKSKGNKSLNNFTKKPLTQDIIDRYKKDNKLLRHVDLNDDKCIAFFDNNDLVAYICVNKDENDINWITALEILANYRGYGLGNQILDYAVKSLNANALAVNKNNKVALQMYEKYGFKISKDSISDVESGKKLNYIMYYNNIMNESNNHHYAYKLYPYMDYITESERSTLTPGFNKKKFEGRTKTLEINSPEAEKYLKQDKDCKRLLPYIKKSIGEIIIDVDNDKFIGDIWINNTDSKGFIQGLGVAKEYRGYGFSDKLVQDAITKYGAIDLVVDKNNEVAINLYKKKGFVIIEGGKDTQYWMKLKSKLTKDDKIIEESYLEESASGFLKIHINDILMKGKSKNEIMNKVKQIEKKYGEEGSKEYTKKDILNTLLAACFIVPSISVTGGTILGAGIPTVGIPLGLTGLYLAGLLHDKKLKTYDKVALLKSTKAKVEKRIEVLEEAQKKEKDPQLKAEIGKRLKDAKATKNYCEKQLFKVAKAKGEVRDRSKDDFDLVDLGDDFNFDDNFDDWSLDESTEILDESVAGSLKVKIHDIITKGKSKDEIVRKVKEIEDNYGDEGSKMYIRETIISAVLVTCFSIPLNVAIGGAAAGIQLSLLYGGITGGLIVSVLSGMIHDKEFDKYDKKSLLTYTKSKVEKSLKSLEKAYNKEKDPKLKKEMESRIKDAKATVDHCNKELSKIKDVKNESTEVLQEYNVLVDGDNIEYNLESLKPIPGENILFITGYSGAGKSTTMSKIKEQYGDNIITVAGDSFYQVVRAKYRLENNIPSKPQWNFPGKECRDCVGPIIYKYMEEHYDKIHLTSGTFRNPELGKYWDSFILWLFDECESNIYRGKIIVVEGIRMHINEIDLYKDRPMIIMGTSIKTSYWRKAKRDIISRKRYDWKHMKTLFSMIPAYYQSSKRIDELRKIMEESTDMIYETRVDKNDCKPVFLVTIGGSSGFSAVIKSFTHSEYSHSGISLTPDLSKILTFNAYSPSAAVYGNSGFAVESIDQYTDSNPNGLIQVLVIFLKNKDYETLVNNINEIVTDKKAAYSFRGIIDVIFNKSRANKSHTMICSEFVDFILKTINVDLTNKSSNITLPKDIATIKNPKVYKIYEGPMVEYDESIIKIRLNNLYKKAEYIKEATLLYEAKELGVKFDEEGDLIIKNPKGIDFKAEHAKSKKLFPTYKKYKNLDGMKYEACKLWYMNIILLKKAEKEKNIKKKDELYDMRAKVMNEFALYINEINKLDETFNFDAYYKATPFNTESIKISGSTIKYSTEYLKLILK